jgi:hypothetical protein
MLFFVLGVMSLIQCFVGKTDRVMRIRGEASPMLPWPTVYAAVDQADKIDDDASVHNSIGQAPVGNDTHLYLSCTTIMNGNVFLA